MPSYDFNLPVDDIFEDAYEMAGGDLMGAQDLRSMKRSMNLLLLDLQNRNIPLSSLEKITIPLTQGTAEYTLDVKVLDLLSVVHTQDTVDLPMVRMGLFDYNNQPNKTQQGRPSVYVIDRQKDAVRLSVWPTPDNSTSILTAWAFRKNATVETYSEYLDIASRYLPAITLGLASFISLKKNPEKYALLKSLYEEALEKAFEEDRERTSFFITPYIPGC